MTGPWSSPCPPLRLRELSFHGPKMPSLPSKLHRNGSLRSAHSVPELFPPKLSYTSPLPKVRFMAAPAATLVCINVFGCFPFAVVKSLDRSLFRTDSGHCPLWWKRLVSSRPQSEAEIMSTCIRLHVLFKHSETPKGMAPSTVGGSSHLSQDKQGSTS